MTDKEGSRQRVNEYAKVWQGLVVRERDGSELTPSEIRTLGIRRSSLEILNCFEEWGKDESSDRGHIKRGDVAERYRDAIQKLKDLGVEKNGDKKIPSGSEDSTTIAEWVGGAIIGTQFMESVSAERPATPRVQDFLVATTLKYAGPRLLAAELDIPAKTQD